MYNCKMQKLFIPILLGTAREGRESEKVAKYVLSEISAHPEIETQFVDVKDFLFGHSGKYSEAATPWKAIMEKADGLIIVSPEYNHSFPGELKILIDSISKEYVKKPVVVIGVSDGRIGGARMLDHIKPILATLGMVSLASIIIFPTVPTAFKADGTPIDETYATKMQKLAKEMVWFAKMLKEGRKDLVA